MEFLFLRGSSSSDFSVELVVFMQYPVASIELLTNPVCVSLSEIAQIPKASLLLDQWEFDFPDN